MRCRISRPRGIRAARVVCVLVGVVSGTLDAFAEHSVSCTSITAPPGAIFLYGDAPNPTFNGTSFAINGNDVKLANGLSGPSPAIWGVATLTENGAEETRNSLNNQQKNNVQGRGFAAGNPATPSVGAESVPNPTEIDQFIDDLLAMGPAYVTTNWNTQINGGAMFGTFDAPRITYFNNASGVTFGNGNATGYGIMIVEHSLTVNGNLYFVGLILVRGPVYVTTIAGSWQSWGSVWATDFQLVVGAHADDQFSSDSLKLAEQAGAAFTCERMPTPIAPTPTSAVTMTPDATVTPACGTAPAQGCQTPTIPHRSVLTLMDRTDDTKDLVSWRWKSTRVGDFGDPTAATVYDLCVYDAARIVLTANIPAGQGCIAGPCWKPTSRGFRYRNQLMTPDGVQQVTLVDAGTGGRSKVTLKAKGGHVDMPALPLTVPVRVQLRNSAGACWEASFSELRANDGRKSTGRSE